MGFAPWAHGAYGTSLALLIPPAGQSIALLSPAQNFNPNINLGKILCAEEVGFEPTGPRKGAVFETAPFGHFGTPPYLKLLLFLFNHLKDA